MDGKSLAEATNCREATKCGMINYNEEEIIEWETWGLFGLGVIAVAVAAGLWFAYG
jgi:hypothetical protein